ncbi:MAG: class II aldolase/adducin family protein [Elusimicrobiota bacterium]|nr:class II aldolase/adducin family protein [Elusimicrobiota bacterium]
MNVLKLKKEICEISHKMRQNDWVAANDGNISVKIGNDRFLTTPTGISKGDMEVKMILEINSKGEVLKENKKYKPSSEIAMHLQCYRDRKDINAVVHAHPPFSTAFAAADIPLDSYSLTEAIISLGAVPIADFALPGTDEVPKSIAKFLPNHDAVLLRSHGALTIGKDLLSAYYKMESLELFAKTSFIARLLGGEKELSIKQIKDCIALRGKYGLKGAHPGYVKFSKNKNSQKRKAL